MASKVLTTAVVCGNILSLSARLAQLVEHMLDVHGVTGSSPVPRTTNPCNHTVTGIFLFSPKHVCKYRVSNAARSQQRTLTAAAFLSRWDRRCPASPLDLTRFAQVEAASSPVLRHISKKKHHPDGWCFFLERATRLELASRHPTNGCRHSQEPCLTS